ncbi:MAG TPA: vitamin K epoxide reductase family protein [Ktedonobacteraceae bacterium]
MNVLRRKGVQIALLVLAILGMADAIYLTLVHYDDQVALICSDSGLVNCTKVITSTYSYVPGTSLPISLPGLGWCLVLAGLAAVGIWSGDERRWLRIAQFVWTLLGMATAVYLVYVEVVALRSICAWCTVLHVLIALAFLIAVVRLPARFSSDEEWEEEEDGAANEIASKPVEQQPLNGNELSSH